MAGRCWGPWGHTQKLGDARPTRLWFTQVLALLGQPVWGKGWSPGLGRCASLPGVIPKPVQCSLHLASHRRQ